MVKKKDANKKIFINIIFLITNLVLFHNYRTEFLQSLPLGLFALDAGLIIVYSWLSYRSLLRRENFRLYSIWLLAILILLIRVFIYGKFEFKTTSLILANTVVGTVLAHNGLNRACQFIFMVIVFSYVTLSYISGVDPMDILGNSRNHISILLLYATILFYLSYSPLEIRQKQYSILPALACFILCIFSLGRMGMVTSGVLFSLLSMLKYWHALARENLLKKALAFLTVTALMLGTFYSINYFSETGKFAKFENQGLESRGRSRIVSTYFDDNNFDGDKLLIGYERGFFEKETGLSAHISYLAWHSYLGIAGIFLMIYALYALVKYYKYSPYHMVLLLAILLRSLTDNVLFFGKSLFGILFVFLVIECERQRLQIKRQKRLTTTGMVLNVTADS
ncbi:MAG: hypothetical protein QNJ46_14000 [Leptolyngbyaceae cyanobacterium MO_188.B28]|nr:hypothetical protein [Leptolyngbyaceae cyanobacterium MO_188.B28]